MTATIRLALPADEPAVVACVNAAYSHYIPRMGKPPGPMLEDYTALIAQGLVHLLTTDEALQGLVVTWPLPDSQFLDNIAVHPDHQGHGIGRRLLAFIEHLAHQANLPAITLYTHELMTENLALYTHLGFVETARRTEKGYNRVYLRKELVLAIKDSHCA